MRPTMRAASLAAGALCIALSASACAGAGGGIPPATRTASMC